MVIFCESFNFKLLTYIILSNITFINPNIIMVSQIEEPKNINIGLKEQYE